MVVGVYDTAANDSRRAPGATLLVYKSPCSGTGGSAWMDITTRQFRGNNMDNFFKMPKSMMKEKGGGGEEMEKESPTLGETDGCSVDAERSRSNSVSSRLSDASVSAKRKRINDGESESVEGCELACMRAIGMRLRKFVFAESNRISKSASEIILNCVGEYEEQMMRMMCKNERLQGKLDECVRRTSQDVALGGCGVSYASMAARNEGLKVQEVSRGQTGNARKNEKEQSYAVIVRAEDASVNVTSEEVKERVMKHVSKSLNVRVKAVRKIKNGGVAIETMSECELKKIRECDRFKNAGLKVELPRKVGPKIILYDVPNELPNEVIIKEMYERNLKERVTEKTFMERVRVVSRNGKKDAACGNVIIEVASCVKDILCGDGRVFVHWKAFRVKEFHNVLRCHKCFAFGHMMKQCSEKERLCQKCGCAGHIMRECKKKSECRNCRIKGCKCDHSVLSEVCPEYGRALEREKARINDE